MFSKYLGRKASLGATVSVVQPTVLFLNQLGEFDKDQSIQSKLSNTDTEGTEQSVRIRDVSV